MPLTSHQHSNRHSGPVATFRRLARRLGTERFSRDGPQHGHQEGHQDGVHDGHRNGAPNGEHDGRSYGTLDGHHDGHRDGATLTFHVVGDTIVACPPGYRPAPTAEEHAREFLHYLQTSGVIPVGYFVAAKTLEMELYPRFVAQYGWVAHSWNTVAMHFGRLVEKRQKDRRSGPDRLGSSPREYRIPRPPPPSP